VPRARIVPLLTWFECARRDSPALLTLPLSRNLAQPGSPMHLATSVAFWGSMWRCHRPWHRRALPPALQPGGRVDAPATVASPRVARPRPSDAAAGAVSGLRTAPARLKPRQLPFAPEYHARAMQSPSTRRAFRAIHHTAPAGSISRRTCFFAVLAKPRRDFNSTEFTMMRCMTIHDQHIRKRVFNEFGGTASRARQPAAGLRNGHNV
jgi:hypothetical protein